MLNFDLKEAMEILERTPKTLENFLNGLSEGWLTCGEGEGTWNSHQIVDHLIDAELNNWVPRIEMILKEGERKLFPPFDRYAHLNDPLNQTIEEKLFQYKDIRAQNIEKIKILINPEKHLEWTGTHPAFGEVKLRELLSTWVVHDLTHLTQIIRVMSERYRDDVGPWEEYLGVLHRNKKKI